MNNAAALATLAAMPGWHRAKAVRAAAGIVAPLADVIAALDALVAAGLAEVRQTDRGPVHAYARGTIAGPRVYRLAPGGAL